VAATENIVTDATSEKSLTVLIVEDEPLVRMLTAEVLEEAGYSVVEAVNASEALELLDARADFCMMITDVRMPGELNGYSLSRLVRLKRPSMPIIVISGDSPPGEGDMPVCARFMSKPVSPSELVEMVAVFLNQSLYAVPRSSGHSDGPEVPNSADTGELASARAEDCPNLGLAKLLAAPDKR
jgi:CheY-like chemotaxis protein